MLFLGFPTKKLIFAFILLCFIITTVLYNGSDYFDSFNVGDKEADILSMQNIGLDEVSCQIPNINPFDSTALRLIEEENPVGEKLKCLGKSSSSKFFKNQNQLIKVNPNSQYWKIVECSFVGYYYDYDTKKLVKDPECSLILNTSVTIPSILEFINVKCFEHNSSEIDYQDQFLFFRLTKQSLEDKHSKLVQAKVLPNIIFLGLDAVSHVNFQRLLPKTHEYLIKNLSAIEFYGRNKISYGTQGNLLGMLTGCKLEKEFSYDPNSKHFPCIPIWNSHFASNGYTSILSEDEESLQTYFYPTLNKNRRRGPELGLSDYDWLPYLLKMIQLNPVGSNGHHLDFGCFKHQWIQDLLTDRVLDVAQTFKNNNNNNMPYFHFIWSATGTHDFTSISKYMDEPMYDLTTKLKTQNLLTNTILIILSDHGTVFGGNYSRTIDGIIEGKMPLLYFVFPSWFQEKYSKAIENMKINAKKLTTPFDLHETLIDLSNLDSISNEQLNSFKIVNDKKKKKNEGLSLFRHIPGSRTCESAGIPEEYCICTKLNFTSSDLNSQDVQNGVQLGLQQLNEELSLYPECSQLQLKGIKSARQSSKLNSEILYEITFKTTPGNGLFEARIKKRETHYAIFNFLTGNDDLRLASQIVRVNAYGTRGACLDKNYAGKLLPSLINSACVCV